MTTTRMLINAFKMTNDESEFISSEHRSLGDVKLPGLDAAFTNFVLPKGTRLTFGEIIALAGDYFGVALKPIALGKTELEKQKRFKAAYASLTQCSPETVYKLTKQIDQEYKIVTDAIAQGKSERDTYNGIFISETAKYIDITDGNYLSLASHNLDHFNQQARVAFFTGYTLAMEAAVAAADMTDHQQQQKQLQYAYSLLAFASHFLTDLFAAGHMRTPRTELEAKFGAEIGSLLSLIQHDEDGDNGLTVTAYDSETNTKSSWTAYGDGKLFETNDQTNRHKAQMAVQEAINELYKAFQTKTAITPSQSLVSKLMPVVSNNSFPPIFKVQGKKILCRYPIDDLQTKKYTYPELTDLLAFEYISHYASNYIDSSVHKNFVSATTTLSKNKKKNEPHQSSLCCVFR